MTARSRQLVALFLVSVLTTVSACATSRDAPAKFGVYLGAGCGGVKRLESFERWFGREPIKSSSSSAGTC